jgi:hypothetical protein
MQSIGHDRREVPFDPRDGGALSKNARVDAHERHLWLVRRGSAGGLDFDRGWRSSPPST